MAKGPFDSSVTADHRGKSAADLVDEAVDALKGVSAGDRQHLADAFGIVTVGDLGSNRFAKLSRAILERNAATQHDPGPDDAWGALLAEAPLAKYQQHPSEFRLDFGPAYYRGRLDGSARVLVVGQDPAPNELVGHRAFVGTSGQRIQAFLRRIGIRRDYVMLNTFLYPIFGQFMGEIRQLSRDPEILGFRNEMFDRVASTNAIEAVIAAGAGAQDAVDRWPGATNFPIVKITHPSAHDHAALLSNWNAGLTTLRGVVEPEVGVVVDTTNYGSDFTNADVEPIPRYDLPFGVPEWHGVGTHARRGRLPDGSTDDKAIIWTAP